MMTKKHMAARCALVLGLCLGGFRAGAEVVDGVVATVGKEVILRSDVMGDVGPLLQSLRGNASSEEAFQQDAEKAFRTALDQSVERELLFREAQLAGYEPQDKDIEERMDKIIKQYDSREAFMTALAKAGQTVPEFRLHLRKEVMALTMSIRKHKEMEDQTTVSENDLAQYYQDHKDQFNRPERIKLRRIFLTAAKDDAARKEVKARLEALREQISQGGDFAALAKEQSQGPEKDDGGALGWVARGDLVEPLNAAAFALANGALSPVLETEFGYTLLKAEERQAASTATLEEVRPTIENSLRTQAAEAKFKKWVGDLRKRSQVRILL